jgi:stearoyl-CoA desaturase (delta-9 desaturase)
METSMKNIFNVNQLRNLQILTLSVYVLAAVSITFIQFSWAMFALTILMYFLIFGFGVSITFHRSITHRALEMNPIVEALGKFFASMGGTGIPISWVLIHKSHHKYSDTDKDPHSAKDILKYLMGKYPTVSQVGIRKLAVSKVNKILHRHYYLIILAYGIVWATAGVNFFFYGFVYPMVLTMIAGHLVNWYTHEHRWFNYKPHNTKDNSQNNIIIGMATWGEGFHNTHHKFPGQANFGTKNWECDISFLFIKLLSILGLVKIRLK